jgi:hypothetical protein
MDLSYNKINEDHSWKEREKYHSERVYAQCKPPKACFLPGLQQIKEVVAIKNNQCKYSGRKLYQIGTG